MKLNRDKIDEIVEKTSGFSVDELKEVIISHNCLKQPLDAIVDRVRKSSGRPVTEDDIDIENCVKLKKCSGCGDPKDKCICDDDDGYNGN